MREISVIGFGGFIELEIKLPFTSDQIKHAQNLYKTFSRKDHKNSLFVLLSFLPIKISARAHTFKQANSP